MFLILILEVRLHIEVGTVGSASPELIAFVSFVCTVVRKGIACVLVPMMMGPLPKKSEQVDVSAVMAMPRPAIATGEHDSANTSVMPDYVDPSTPYDAVDPTSAPVIPDDVGPATPNDAIDSTDAPTISDYVDPAISDAVAPVTSGGGDSVTRGAHAFMIPNAVPAIRNDGRTGDPGDAPPGGSWRRGAFMYCSTFNICRHQEVGNITGKLVCHHRYQGTLL